MNKEKRWQECVKPWPKRLERWEYLYASINSRGDIAFNALLHRDLRDTASVELFYDPETQCIGIRYPTPGDKHFFRVRSHGRNGRSSVVRAARLLKQFGIKIDRTLVFEDIHVTDGPMLVLDLRTAVPIERSPKETDNIA